MRLIGDTKFDFMGKRGICLSLSAVLIIGAIGVLMTKGIEKGVEFSGGAHVILHYVDPPRLDDVRDRLIESGISGSSVTAFGETSGAEIVIRVPLPEGEQEGVRDRDVASEIVQALQSDETRTRVEQGLLNLNVADQVTLENRFIEDVGLDAEAAADAASRISVVRRQQSGVFASLEEVAQIEGVGEEVQAFLRENAFIGAFSLRGQEFIEASISAEMRDKALAAIVLALTFMGAYIWLRFQFQWGIAAIVALVHDTLITLGAFSLVGMEANLPVVAAFLTLVGYSVNDTIVVFDRVRENLRSRGTGALTEVINLSINQNLSRTVITSLTTLLVVLSLYFFGGPVIHPFAFVLLLGVIVGTYSSIFVASPVLLFWQRVFGKSTAAAKAKMPRSGKRVSS